LIGRRARYCSLACFERALPGHSHWCDDRAKEKERRALAATVLAQAQSETRRVSDGLVGLSVNGENEVVARESHSVEVAAEGGDSPLPTVTVPEGYA
jgi:hypothetical protein